MATTLTIKGQITIPKRIRDSLQLAPGDSVDFAVNEAGQVVIRKLGKAEAAEAGCFEAVRGKAQIRWRTDELMALLRD